MRRKLGNLLHPATRREGFATLVLTAGTLRSRVRYVTVTRDRIATPDECLRIAREARAPVPGVSLTRLHSQGGREGARVESSYSGDTCGGEEGDGVHSLPTQSQGSSMETKPESSFRGVGCVGCALRESLGGGCLPSRGGGRQG